MAKNSDWTGDWFKEFKEDRKQEKIGWAAIFFYGALVVLADTTGFASRYAWWDGWAVFFTGFGVIVLIGMILYLFKGKTGKAIWNLVWGLIFLAIGLGDFLNFGLVWVAILAVIGFAILKGAFPSKRRR
jgi:hypothetical protein